MSRIVLISDSPNVNTGYGVTSHNLGRELRRLGHDICFIGFAAAGAPTYHKLDSEDVPIYEGNTTTSIENAFIDWKPDLAKHIRDAFVHSSKWHTHPYSFVNIPNRPKIILWTPVQSDNLPDEFVQACISECDFCVTFTKWGSDVLLFQGVPSNRMSSIWLGFDPEVFKPTEVEKDEYGFSKERPLVGSVGISDQYRKGWPILLRAFSLKMVVSSSQRELPNRLIMIPSSFCELLSGYIMAAVFLFVTEEQKCLIFVRIEKKVPKARLRPLYLNAGSEIP